MRKIIGIICITIGVCTFFGSCSKSESYADKVKNERKYIKNFLSENNIVELSSYPANGVFKSNEFYLDPSGVYINVVDSGNGKRANDKNRAEVYFRFSETMTLPASESDTVSLSSMSTQPLSFNYGLSSTYTTTDTYTPGYLYLSTGVTIPLKYVGEKAIVRLLVPFSGSVGSTGQTSNYMTLYYGQLEYTKIIN